MAYTSWAKEIYARLKTGSIKNIVIYGNTGTSKVPPEAPPYVTVKFEQAGINGFARVAFYVHGAKGCKDLIEGYAARELRELLSTPIVTEDGRLSLRFSGEFIPDLAVSDDDTISCRVSYYFLAPALIGNF